MNEITNAIAIAAHEVGHAIQDHQGDKRLAIIATMYILY